MNISSLLGSFLKPQSAPGSAGQVRFVTFGQEFQPSRRRQKRKHGYLHRKSTPSGRKIIERRIAKGRTTLSH